YSKTDVYEVIWSTIPVMRRISDDYVNASSILKAAKVPKPRRVKVLKRLCELVPFEKITEGFYTFQGIWIPKSAAEKLAIRWEIYEFIKPLFD
ncbi:transcription regulator HTH, apses-type DNA-binding domain-containing protein, partial [Globomyces pollinis-pini]